MTQSSNIYLWILFLYFQFYISVVTFCELSEDNQEVNQQPLSKVNNDFGCLVSTWTSIREEQKPQESDGQFHLISTPPPMLDVWDFWTLIRNVFFPYLLGNSPFWAKSLRNSHSKHSPPGKFLWMMLSLTQPLEPSHFAQDPSEIRHFE